MEKNKPLISPMLPLLKVPGCELIPLQKHDALDKNGKYAGKRPLHNDWRNEKALTESTLRTYVDQGHNIGNRTGREILVVDIDPKNFPIEGETDRDGKELDVRPDILLEKTFGFKREDYPMVLTGSRFPKLDINTGQHIYMSIPADWIPKDKKLRRGLEGYKGIDFKWLGGQVVIPGSVNAEKGRGNYYEWETENHPDIADGLPPAPKELIDALLSSVKRTKAGDGTQEVTPEALAKTLATMVVEDFRDHETWLEFMMACHAATQGDGIDEFVAWSCSDPLYAHAGSDISYRWESFDANLDGGITAASFYHIVNKHHGVVSAVSDFDDLSPQEMEMIEADAKKVKEKGPLGPLLPEYTRSGEKYTDTQSNALRFLVKIIDEQKWRVRFNTFLRRIEITHPRLIPGENPADLWDSEIYPYLNEQLLNNKIWLIVNGWCVKKNIPLKSGISAANIHHALSVIADQQRYNPLTEYLDALQWDGEPRIDRWITDRLGGPDDELTQAASRMLFQAMVARAYKPGTKYDMLIVLEGMQGTRKSTAMKELCPKEDWFTDHAMEFSGRGNPADAIMPFIGKWLHEFPEISTLTPATMNKAKAMLSKSLDSFRKPYGKGFEDAPRTFVSVGTTNDSVYLADMTGNRRFLPIRLDNRDIDTDAIKRERNDLFAEAVAMYKADPDAPVQLPQRYWKAAASSADLRQADHPWADKLHVFLDGRTRVASIELHRVVGIKGSHGANETKTLAAVMNALGWEHKKAVRIPAKEYDPELLVKGRAYSGYAIRDITEITADLE